MQSIELEKQIYHCPYTTSKQCRQRLDCHPIPGGGPPNPKFIILGLNPAARNNIWQKLVSLEETKQEFIKECLAQNFGYGKLLSHLEAKIPDFKIKHTVYLTDVVKCPTTDNNVPSAEMIAKCKEAYWKQTLATLNPKYIIVLGSNAAKAIGGPIVTGSTVRATKLLPDDRWFIFAPHPSQKSHQQIVEIAQSIADTIKNPTENQISISNRPVVSSLRDGSVTATAKEKIQNKLLSMGYRKQGTKMVKDNRTVNIVVSQEYGSLLRVRWDYFQWQDDFATIYDYSATGGPTCIVPLEKLFATKFFTDLKKRPAFNNNKGVWSAAFPVDKEIPQLVLSYKDKWDLL
jgi:uracil-DNA glycosylase